MQLKLIGYFSGFDKYGRMIFVKETTSEGRKSMKKLWTLQKEIDGRSPITPRGFSVVISRSMKKNISYMNDINECIGCHCVIKPYVKEYDFVNKEGVQMKGFTLELTRLYYLSKHDLNKK